MKRGQLGLSGYVVLAVIAIFTIICVMFLYPIVTAMASDASYGGGLSWGLYLIPAVMVIGAFVAFFIPNTVLR